MKKKYIIPIALLFALCGYGQGNYYPASGNVGIGTLTPNYSLEVAGTFSASEIIVNGTEFVSSPWTLNGSNTFYSAGRVGIGTNNPGFALDVAGTVNATNLLINGSPLPASPWSLNGLNAFYNAGRVGIGTNNPGFALDVAGTVNATNLLINGAPLPGSPWSLSGSNTFYSAGNVGIGTNTPDFELDVEGTINANELRINGALLTSSPWSVNGNDTFYNTGNVGIGTSNTQGYRLAVDGNMVAEEIKVELSQNWPDYVFTKSYDLPTLEEVERHILDKGHLENIPSAAQVELNGIKLGEMNSKLLQKIEELTLYVIQQQKEIEALKLANSKLEGNKESLELLTSRLDKLEKLIINNK
ncbi:hypothetical protein [Arenibacter sp. F20364]|uniref:hypothetical protein n=1 Tax=Arenibacter sp. F20364 TaxID=2926415 RepID=UPI001FF5B851|nr:hypothetical protein [Arenibacter sp. F20364]MCK0191553.1 hypothetical protein [Arenibacter sp. F20364]